MELRYKILWECFKIKKLIVKFHLQERWGFLFDRIFINKNNMKKIVRLTESDLSRIVKRTIMEMDMDMDMDSETINGLKRQMDMEVEETDSVDASSVIEDFMQSIADMRPEKQLEAIEDMMFQLKMYKTNLGFAGKGNPNAR